MGLNTNVFYKSNDLVDEEDDDPLGQLSWLESQLQDCRESDSRTLIFAHVPPGKFERYYQPYDGEEGGYGFPWFRADLNDQFLKIIDDYSDVIAGQFYGHHHTDMVKVTGDSSWAALAPALAPMRSTLAPETGATNPALRLVLFDKDTGEVRQLSLLLWKLFLFYMNTYLFLKARFCKINRLKNRCFLVTFGCIKLKPRIKKVLHSLVPLSVLTP